MAQSDDGRGNLYEQVLEYAKREMDEAASKMNEIKQSLELLEARVEAAKAVYQAVASRLNLEDEADHPGFQVSFPEVPAHVPEPPLAEHPTPAATLAPKSAPKSAPESAPASEVVGGNGTPSRDPQNPISDLDLIRQHLAGKAQSAGSSAPPPAPAEQTEQTASAEQAEVPAAQAGAGPGSDTPPLTKPPTAEEDDSFSMRLIRQHLEQKSKEQDISEGAPKPDSPAPAEPTLDMSAIVPDASPSAEEPPASGAGLSEADRELIGAYLRSKQN